MPATNEVWLRPDRCWHRIHRQMLQLLQWRCPRIRWVLKSPGHLWSLPALLAEYPDACLVATHRDPLKVLSSVTSLTTTLRAMASDRIDPGDIAREWSYWNAKAFDAAVTARETGLVTPERVIDVQFGELMADPIEVIRRIYAKFDLELTDVAAERMRRYLAANPDDKHGKHGHRFADTGLDVRVMRGPCAAFAAGSSSTPSQPAATPWPGPPPRARRSRP